MRAQIVARNAEFGGVLSALVESVNSCVANWIPDWNLDESKMASLVLAHVGHADEMQQATKLLQAAQRRSPSASVILIGDEFDAETKIELLQLGAVDCLERPVNLQRLRYLVDSISLRVAAQQERRGLEAARQLASDHANVSRFESTIQKLASVDTNLLLVGETGVGKTFIARRIHEQSHRSNDPFTVINCAAIPDALFESELFGHKKGSFTGAEADQIGKLAHAGNGTILLDDIDALPAPMQAKLLHAVEDREFRSIGSNDVSKLSARLIAATNQNLEELVAAGKFRPDLFYRIDAYEFAIPPLRERIEELPQLVAHFVQDYAKRNRCQPFQLTDEVMELFQVYPWPGNLRELRNSIEHAAINQQSPHIGVEDLPERIQQFWAQPLESDEAQYAARTIPMKGRQSPHPKQRGSDPSNHHFDLSKSKHEIKYLLQVLEQNNYNRTQAAKEMGISRAAFYKKLNRYHLA